MSQEALLSAAVKTALDNGIPAPALMHLINSLTLLKEKGPLFDNAGQQGPIPPTISAELRDAAIWPYLRIMARAKCDGIAPDAIAHLLSACLLVRGGAIGKRSGSDCTAGEDKLS